MDVGGEMIDTLNYIQQRYGLNFEAKSPIEIPNVGRGNLAKLFAELGFKTGVEIGVQEGIYSEVLCRANPEMTLCSIDPWRAYEGYRDHSSQKELDAIYEEAVARLSNYNCIIVRKTSMEALADFSASSLDFVYIDGNHEIPWVMDDICWWASKVRIGGIVAGHDYFISKRSTRTQIHVKYAVDCAARALNVNPYFMVGASLEWEKLAAMRERPSWFWIKDTSQWTLYNIS